MSSLEDFILEYKDSETGELVVTLATYYERYIKPLRREFSRWSFLEDKLVLCWFPDHEDVNPSMGYIPDRTHKGQYIYHCFGCGKSGNVVRLHQQIEELYHNNRLSVEDACRDLAAKFGIQLPELSELSEDDYEGKYLRKLRKIDIMKYHYTRNDYIREIRKNRVGTHSLDALNSENVKMIATEKHLYD